VEARDVGGRVVDQGVVEDGVGPAIGDADEGVAAGPREAGAEAAEDVRRDAVLERAAETRPVGEPAVRVGHLADGEQLDLRRGRTGRHDPRRQRKEFEHGSWPFREVRGNAARRARGVPEARRRG
jgi:hypothetical protein